MDGFHLANDELVRLGRLDRKGAPDTFDAGGFVHLLRRLHDDDEAVVYAPRFDRSLEESIGSAVPVPAAVPLLIVEGNYLLYDEPGWNDVAGLLDECWYLDPGEEDAAGVADRAAPAVRTRSDRGRRTVVRAVTNAMPN